VTQDVHEKDINWGGEPAPAAGRAQSGAGHDSQATKIIRLAIEARCEFWHTPAAGGYLTLMIEGHHEHHPLTSRAARDYLSRLFYADTGRAPNGSALQDALATISGISRFDGPEHPVFVRVGGHAGRIYLDLADPSGVQSRLRATGGGS